MFVDKHSCFGFGFLSVSSDEIPQRIKCFTSKPICNVSTKSDIKFRRSGALKFAILMWCHVSPDGVTVTTFCLTSSWADAQNMPQMRDKSDGKVTEFWTLEKRAQNLWRKIASLNSCHVTCYHKEIYKISVRPLSLFVIKRKENFLFPISFSA